jgi:hypothetical protein
LKRRNPDYRVYIAHQKNWPKPDGQRREAPAVDVAVLRGRLKRAIGRVAGGGVIQLIFESWRGSGSPGFSPVAAVYEIREAILRAYAFPCGLRDFC